MSSELPSTAPAPTCMTLAARRSAFVMGFLELLGDRAIILRNHDEILRGEEKDVDCLIEASDILDIRTKFADYCAANDARPILSSVGIHGLALASIFGDSVFERPVRFDMTTFVSLHVTARARRVKGEAIRIRRGDFDTRRVAIGSYEGRAPALRWQLIFLLQRWALKTKPRYRDELLSLVEKACPPHMAPALRNAVISRDGDELGRLIGALLSEVGMLSPLSPQRLARAVSGWAALLLGIVRTMPSRRGLIIQFSGPDGAGKSTTSEVASEFLTNELGRPVRSIKGLTLLGNRMAAPMDRIQGMVRGVPKNADSTKKQIEHRDRRPAGRALIWKFRRFLGLASYILQYLPSYFMARLASLLGVNYVVDTCIIDRFVKSHRPKFRILEKFVSPILPLGDVVYYLKADAQAIAERKRELTVDELTDYYEVMGTLLGGRDEVVSIDTTSSLSDARDVLRATLADRLAAIAART